MSVVVPVYDVAPWIDRCVESLVGQTYRCLQIILVDDGSTDGSFSLCKQWESRDTRVVAIGRVHGGLSAARNTGLDLAVGEYIAFVDSDDYVEPDMIASLVETLKAARAGIAICGYFEHCVKAVQMPCSYSGEAYVQSRDYYIESVLSGTGETGGVVWGKLYPRRLFESLRFAEGRVYEDIALFPQMVRQIDTAVIVERPLYHHCVRAGSISQTRSCVNLDDWLHAQVDLIGYLADQGVGDEELLRIYETNFVISAWIMCQQTEMPAALRVACQADFRDALAMRRECVGKLSSKRRLAAKAILRAPRLSNLGYAAYCGLQRLMGSV